MNKAKRKSIAKKIFKIFFWIFSAAQLYVLISSIGILDSAFSYFVFGGSEIVIFFGAVGIYLYAHEKSWLPVRFWKIIFFLFVMNFLYAWIIKFMNLKVMFQTEPGRYDNYILLYIFAIGAILCLPTTYALYQYAFKRKG